MKTHLALFRLRRLEQTLQHGEKIDNGFVMGIKPSFELFKFASRVAHWPQPFRALNIVDLACRGHSGTKRMHRDHCQFALNSSSVALSCASRFSSSCFFSRIDLSRSEERRVGKE